MGLKQGQKSYRCLDLEYANFMSIFDQFDEGIIISDQLSLGELLRRVERLLQALSAEELQNTLRYLQFYR